MATKPAIGVVISTYDRVDDAKIGMEIIRECWSEHFDVHIVHAYNGDERAWPRQGYLEDDLVILPNRGHYQGAVDLLEIGIQVLAQARPAIAHAVHLSADTWMVKPARLVGLLAHMKEWNQPFASSAWGSPDNSNPWQIGLALDFCIVELAWAKTHKMFPLGFDTFRAQHGEALRYLGQIVYPERVLAMRFLDAVERARLAAGKPIGEGDRWRAGDKMLCRIFEREPVHDAGERRMGFPELGLWTHHEPLEKQRLLRAAGLGAIGPCAQKLATLTDLSYYNLGA